MRHSLIMTLAKRRAFVEDGVVILPKLVPQELCCAATEAIEKAETENVGESEQVQALYHGSPLCTLLQELLGGETLPITSAQIAVRHPTPPEQLAWSARTIWDNFKLLTTLRQNNKHSKC